jgi:hypothetical protein
MSVSKVCTLIIFYFLSRVALAGPGETFTGHAVTERCATKPYDALAFLEEPAPKVTPPAPVGGQNPATLFCHELKLPVVILKDARENEQSFCTFKDGPLADPNALERHLKRG